MDCKRDNKEIMVVVTHITILNWDLINGKLIKVFIMKNVLYCIVFLFNVSFYNSGYSLFQTNIKQFHGLYKALHLLHKEHVHLFSWDQVLIEFLNF